MEIQQRVNLAGMAGTLNALRKLDPEVAKGIGKELNLAGRKIRDDARKGVPSQPAPQLRNWRTTPARRPQGKRRADGTIDRSYIRAGGFPAWKPQDAKKGIRSSRREFVLTIQSQESSLGIFEFAGTKGGKGRGSSGSPQGRWFMSLLPAIPLNSGRRLQYGRVMRKALRDNYAETRVAIAEAAFKAAGIIQRRMP